MNGKMQCNSFLENNTWELVPPPENKNVIGSKWVYKVKRNADQWIC
jgi:hypothetical protein